MMGMTGIKKDSALGRAHCPRNDDISVDASMLALPRLAGQAGG